MSEGVSVNQVSTSVDGGLEMIRDSAVLFANRFYCTFDGFGNIHAGALRVV